MALLHWLFFSIQRWCRIFMFRYCINVGKQIISILSTAVQKNSSIAHSLLLVLIGGYFDNHPHSLWCPSFSVTIVQIEKRPIYGNPSARALIDNHRAFCIFSVHLFNDFIGLDTTTRHQSVTIHFSSISVHPYTSSTPNEFQQLKILLHTEIELQRAVHNWQDVADISICVHRRANVDQIWTTALA